MTNSTPVVINTIGDLRTKLASLATSSPGGRVGFVPTMGYLHDGHAMLVRRARSECDVVVVSIFVNPTQFGPGEDFAAYPRDLERDLSILHAERADIVFAPDAKEFYPPGADTTIAPGAVAEPLEGERRPGHFRGVATVVTMLFNAVRPTHAYFGEKDWQQLQVVRHLVNDLHFPVSIIAVPTAREADGLAMSSRNVRLSANERAAAVCLARAITVAQQLYAAGEHSPAVLERAMVGVIAAEPLAHLDYATVVDGRTLRPTGLADAASRALLAVRIGSVRLIDNASL